MRTRNAGKESVRANESLPLDPKIRDLPKFGADSNSSAGFYGFHKIARVANVELAKRQNAPATETVFDLLPKNNLWKVADTFIEIRNRLGSADPQEKLILLVQACRVVGLL